jgi:hypothetical protein
MRNKKIFIILVFSICMKEFAFAQQTSAKADSTLIYKNIELYSKKSKFTKFIYKLVFKPVAISLPINKGKKKVYKKLIQKQYSAFEGKPIRRINIETLDPFGYSVADTIATTGNLAKTGNKLHVKSMPITIRNLLLIRQNQLFDSLLVKESERLVRARGYVHNVSFLVTTLKNADSVDILIRELDNWSIIPQIIISNSHTNFALTDKNFIGLGHELRTAYTLYHHTDGNNNYNINYFIPNIRNTYINSTLHYGSDEYGNFSKSLTINRPFYSAFAKWAAGANFMQQFCKDSILAGNLFYVLRQYKFNTQNYWVGNAIQIFKGNTEYKRTTNLITAVSFLRIRYLEKPIAMYDMSHIFSNENFYLGSIGISTRKYVQDKFIFNFGVIEDVPVGQLFNLTAGYQIKENTGRLYIGAQISSGNYHSWGYLSSNIEYGTFLHASHSEQGVVTAGVNYFTGLIEIGNWKFRQFVKPQITFGINRFSYDSLTLNNSLEGFNSSKLSGTNRILFMLQTQSYAPWNFIGFRFGPYLVYSLGMLGDAMSGFKNSKAYSQIGLGVLIRNENLVIGTFQISISFYPSIPGIGQDILKINSFKTTDFGFKDFEIKKPATTLYQ